MHCPSVVRVCVCSNTKSGTLWHHVSPQLICLCYLLGCTAQYHPIKVPEYIGGYIVDQDLCHNVMRDCVSIKIIDLGAGHADLQLMHCVHDPTGRDKRQGAFVFSRTSPVPGEAHDIYRVRMVGHELLTLQLYACNSSMVVGPYSILIGGQYKVAVLQTYDNFTFGSRIEPRDYNSMLLTSFEMEVVSPDLDWGCAWEDSDTCPICSDPEAEGRWIVREPRLLGELDYCAANCNMPEIEAMKTRKSAIPGISWQPYTCNLAPLESIDVHQCLKERRICLVGDSHMRHIQHGISSLIINDLEYHNQDPLIGKPEAHLDSDKTIGESDNVMFIPDRWGNPWGAHNLSACTDIFANFGNWPASYETGSSAWPSHQYALAAENQAEFLMSLRQEGKHVYWINSPSHAPDPGRTGIDDWRSDRLLSLYNSISHQAVAHKTIPVIDQYSITDPLHDMAYDKYHFKGLVGFYIHLRILNVLCFHEDATMSV